MVTTPVHFSYVKPSPTGDVPVLGARVRFALRVREVADGTIRTTDAFTVTFPNGSGVVNLSPTGVNQAWQILELSPISSREDVNVTVPTSVSPVEFSALPRVNETSFEVVGEPAPIWEQNLTDLAERVTDLENNGGGGGGGGGAVTSVNTKVGVVVLTQDDIGDGTTAKKFTATEKTKLSGVATGATANQSDATVNAAVGAKYTKPGTGIPATDLDAAVQTSLSKADSAASTSAVSFGDSTTLSQAKAYTDSNLYTLSLDVAAKYTKPGSGIPGTDLSTAVQVSLAKADTAPVAADVTNALVAANNYTDGRFVALTGANNGLAQLGADGQVPNSQIGPASQYGFASSTDLDNTFAIASAAIPASQKAANNGVATLDGTGKLLTSQLPDLAVTDFLGSSTNQAAMLAKTGQKGDWTTRTDLGSVWIITGSDPTQLASWTAMTYPASPVTTVAGRTGAIVLAQSDITNLVSDLALKAPLASPAFTGTPTGITKAHVGLGSVDNTADTAKPVSTAQQTALNLKQDISTLTETVQDIVGAFLVQGTNVTLAYDDVANSLTINSTGGGGGGLDLETVQDAVAAMILPTGTGLTKTYDDTAGTLTLTLDLSTKQNADAALTALAALATNGSIHRTAANTYVSRTLTGSTYILVTNGDGVAGNPTIAIQSTIPVANGGSGRATGTTAYGLVAVGTTATGAQQTVAPGTAGTFLKSAGAAALPAYTAIAESDVTNLVTDLGLKAPLASPAFTGTPTGITATHVGLGSVNNTADTAKPVSTAQAAADAAVQAAAIQRANHTGTQSADTIVDGTTNKVYTAAEKTKLAGIATAATANQSDATTNAAIAAKVGSDGSLTQIIKLTQAAYNALTPVSTTLYVIVG